jgi:hypothetical protein
VFHAHRRVVPKVHPSAWIVVIHRSTKIYISLAPDYRAASAE